MLNRLGLAQARIRHVLGQLHHTKVHRNIAKHECKVCNEERIEEHEISMTDEQHHRRGRFSHIKKGALRKIGSVDSEQKSIQGTNLVGRAIVLNITDVKC